MKRTTCAPNLVFCNDVDKGLNFVMEFYIHLPLTSQINCCFSMKYWRNWWHLYGTVMDLLYYRKSHTIGLLSIQIDKYKTYCIAQPVLFENKPKLFAIQSCKCENRCINGTFCFQVKIIFITCDSLLRPKMFAMLSLTVVYFDQLSDAARKIEYTYYLVHGKSEKQTFQWPEYLIFPFNIYKCT